jgi:hypothetical protein
LIIEAFFTFKKAAKKYSSKTLKLATFNKSKNDLDVLVTTKVPFLECYSKNKGRFLFEGEFTWESLDRFMKSVVSEAPSEEGKQEPDVPQDDTDL